MSSLKQSLQQSPLMRYEQQLLKDGFVRDPIQVAAVTELDRIYLQLAQRSTKRLWQKKQPVKGLYLWGDVGRGKTFLMDLFYDSLPDEGKLRMHFYRFMMHIHTEMREVSGRKNPLEIIAKRLAKRCHVLCFDEFFVSDIGDAILLGGLFKALFKHGLTLITTSNIPISSLYMDELHKHRFDSARALLHEHLDEFHLSGGEDHRLRHLDLKQTYFINNEVDPRELFEELSQGQVTSSHSLIINHREMIPQCSADSVVWFRFNDLCAGPRAPQDYVSLANQYATVLVSEVPTLGGEIKNWIKARGTEDGSGDVTETGNRVVKYARLDDPARRFISMVDELYDRRVNLYIVADVPLDELYAGGALSFEFTRTHSRLVEMQSLDYLDQAPIMPTAV